MHQRSEASPSVPAGSAGAPRPGAPATAAWPRHRAQLAVVFFGCCLLYHGQAVLAGWDRPIADFNPWRQSQTAIAVWYYLNEGFSLATSVPVLGPPWTIPFEFPTYQVIVALLSRATGWPMESCGRGVSLAAFYATLPALFHLLRALLGLTYQRWVILGLFFVAPLYISLSRTFSIESTALALSVWYVFWFHRWLVRPGMAAGLAVAGLGALAAATKITTFFAYAVATVPVFLAYQREPLTFLRQEWRRALAGVLAAYVLPLGAGLLWTHYADAVKIASPLTAHFASSEMTAWNFGSLAQRVAPETARRFELFAGNLVCNRYQLLFAALCVALFPRHWRAILGLLLLFVIPPLVFTNLYFAHDYYWYANGVFVLLALGLAFSALFETRRVPWAAAAIACVLVFYQYRNTYLGWYGPKQLRETSPALPLAARLHDLVGANEYCVVFGFDWDPTLAYHSRRRMIMQPFRHQSVPVNAEPLASAIARAGRERLAAVVFVGDSRANTRFVSEQLQAAGAAPVAAYADDFGTVYLRNRPGEPAAP